MTSPDDLDGTVTIGEVVRRTGLSERALRYYEELGLVAPARDAGGRRRYDRAALDRLTRVRLLRALATPVAEVDPDAHDLAALTRRHLASLDDGLSDLARRRERVRAVEDRLLAGTEPSDASLLDLLEGLGAAEPTAVRRITLLVYRDLAAAHAWLVDVLGLDPGELTWVDGQPVHGVVHVGDGQVWLHREAPEHRMVSPVVHGTVTASLAVEVDDVDAHHARTLAAGARVVAAPVDQVYGLREYSLLDLEGHLWSFQQDLAGDA
ncbi:hypothetical protein GCM10009737_12920 [Nocardioides lentus]|uniref:MerR family transcriptional regulator n=1 Tax=Nocardioides lentus TaxID=338077 RepID=A0ABP5AI55_9ACTN